MLKEGKELKIYYLLSIPLIILTIIAAMGELLIEDLHKDTLINFIGFTSFNILTLFIVIPIFITSLLYSVKGSLKATLIWMGCLGYTLYTYILYTCTAEYNEFFLIYVTIFSLSLYMLIGISISLNPIEIKEQFKTEMPKKLIAGILIVTGILFLFFWVMQNIGILIKEDFSYPEEELKLKYVFAIDIGFLFPLMAISGICLIKEKPFGYIFSGVSLVKGMTIGLGLTIGGLLELKAGVFADYELYPMFVIVGIVFSIALFIYIKNIEPSK